MSDRRVQLPPHLWEILQAMAGDMAVPVDVLVHQAVFNWARLNGYAKPSHVFASSQPDAEAALSARPANDEREPPPDTPHPVEKPVEIEPVEIEPVEIEPVEIEPVENGPTLGEKAVQEAGQVVDEPAEMSSAPSPIAPQEKSEPAASKDLATQRTVQVVRVRAINDDVRQFTRPVGEGRDALRGDTTGASEAGTAAESDDWEMDETSAATPGDVDYGEPAPEQGGSDISSGASHEAAVERVRAISADVLAFTTPFVSDPELTDPSEEALVDAPQEDEDISEPSVPVPEPTAPAALESGDSSSADEPVDEQEPAAESLGLSDEASASDPAQSPQQFASDYDKLLADLEDLESDLDGLDEQDETSTQIYESSAQLTLTVDESGPVLVSKTPFTIGRTERCDLRIPSERVSREHAVIERDGPFGFRIVDRNSSNGLWFEDERILERNLQDGDVLRIGDSSLRATITTTSPE